MVKFDYDLIVIGGGAAGLTAATFAGQSSAKTLLVEKEKKLGGDCLHYGCIPSKALIKSAYACNVIRHSTAYGLPEIKLQKIDFSKIRDRINGIIDTVQERDEPAYLQKKYNVETEFGEPHFIDRNTIYLNGRNVSSRYFIVATGSEVFIPPIEGIRDVPFMTHKDVFALEHLPKDMIILGGGPIGLEMAQAFYRLGVKVRVVECALRIFVREDEDVAQYMTKIMKEEGIEIMTGTKVTQVSFKEGLFYLTVDKGGQEDMVCAEVLLVSTGRVPNVSHLDLEKAGVQYTSKGVKVNAKMKTTTKNIYACGDVNGGLTLTHIASYEAVVAVTNMILKIPSKVDYTNTPWCTYLDPEVASIGYNEMRAREKGIDCVVHKEYLKHNDRALTEGETKGFIKILIDKRGRPIGVQIIGLRAGDLIHEWVPVLNTRLKLSAIINSIHAYPTLAEVSKNAAVNYYVSTVPSWTKKILKFIFRYQGDVL